MIRLRWTVAAVNDLKNIADYFFEESPEHAVRVVRKIFDAPSLLTTFPNRGRLGKVPGTRELVMSSLPYVVIYRVEVDVVYIVRILHAAQMWPL